MTESKEARAERLAAALRENLRKRKGRARAEQATVMPPEPPLKR